jgi:16S rRNA (guanine1207-N2)-methyltransferase
MSDAATRLLLQYIAAAPGPTLWLADEQVDAATVAATKVRADLSAISNRCDVAAALMQRGVPVTAADFDGEWPTSRQHMAFRIAKEKALVHYLINRALEQLPAGGELFLSGYKN